MERVDSYRIWEYLKDWEFNYLTAEACGVGMRIRVDVGPKGQELLWTLFGGMELTNKGWNTPEWKTMMLPYDLEDTIVVWALLQTHDAVVRETFTKIHAGPVYIGYSSEEWKEKRDKINQPDDVLGRTYRYWSKTGTAAGGLMNQHMWSGGVW